MVEDDGTATFASNVMGLQMLVVGSMAVSLFALFIPHGRDGRDVHCGSVPTDEEDSDDEGATEAERRVARAYVKGMGFFCVGAVAAWAWTVA